MKFLRWSTQLRLWPTYVFADTHAHANLLTCIWCPFDGKCLDVLHPIDQCVGQKCNRNCLYHLDFKCHIFQACNWMDSIEANHIQSTAQWYFDRFNSTSMEKKNGETFVQHKKGNDMVFWFDHRYYRNRICCLPRIFFCHFYVCNWNFSSTKWLWIKCTQTGCIISTRAPPPLPLKSVLFSLQEDQFSRIWLGWFAFGKQSTLSSFLRRHSLQKIDFDG